jgi:hypothetical protein
MQVSTRSVDFVAACQRAEDWYQRCLNGQAGDAVLRLYRNAKQRAKRDGIPFTLRPTDLTIPEVCPVLGIPLFRQEGGPCDNSPTIDRIDNTQGYVRKNVIVVSYRANRIKSDATVFELHRIAAFYAGLAANPIFHSPRAKSKSSESVKAA